MGSRGGRREAAQADARAEFEDPSPAEARSQRLALAEVPHEHRRALPDAAHARGGGDGVVVVEKVRVDEVVVRAGARAGGGGDVPARDQEGGAEERHRVRRHERHPREDETADDDARDDEASGGSARFLTRTIDAPRESSSIKLLMRRRRGQHLHHSNVPSSSLFHARLGALPRDGVRRDPDDVPQGLRGVPLPRPSRACASPPANPAPSRASRAVPRRDRVVPDPRLASGGSERARVRDPTRRGHPPPPRRAFPPAARHSTPPSLQNPPMTPSPPLNPFSPLPRRTSRSISRRRTRRSRRSSASSPAPGRRARRWSWTAEPPSWSSYPRSSYPSPKKKAATMPPPAAKSTTAS